MTERPPRPRGALLSLAWLLLFTALSMGLLIGGLGVAVFVIGGASFLRSGIGDLFSTILNRPDSRSNWVWLLMPKQRHSSWSSAQTPFASRNLLN